MNKKYVQKTTAIFFMAGVFFLSIALTGKTAENAVKRPLGHGDYDGWRSISSQKISSDGRWVLYLDTPQKGEGSIVVFQVNGDKKYSHAIGFTGTGATAHRSALPEFTVDNSHVIFLISPTQEDVKAAKKDKKIKNFKKMGVMSLSDGNVTVIDRVKNFKIPENAGGWVAYLLEKPEEKKEEKKTEGEEVSPAAGKTEEETKKEEKKKEKKKTYGTAFVIHHLKDGTEFPFADVVSYEFTKDGRHLYFVVSSKESPEKDGLYDLIPGRETPSPLLSGKGNYSGLVFDEKETKLAFFTDRDDYESDPSTLNLYGCDVGAEKADLWISHTSTPDFPEGLSVSDLSPISFSEDGSVMMFGIKDIPEQKKDEEEETEGEGEDEETAKFELWHWNDPYPQPQQIKMEERVRNNTWETVYHFHSKKLVKLADAAIPDVELCRNGKIAFAETIEPYTKRVSHDGSYYDIYLIDPQSGDKTLVRKDLYGGANLSPNGKYVTWFEGKDWYVYDIAKKNAINLTKDLDVRFDREDWDTPSPSYGYGSAGWTENDASILLYDKFDIWEFLPDGSEARMITEGYGRKNGISFRYIRTDPEEKTIKPTRTMLLRATNEDTMTQGFYSDTVSGKSSPQKLLMEEKSFSFPTKAKNADLLLLTRSAFDEYPDLWIADARFKKFDKLTDLGSQMNGFLWGTEELLDFKSSDGKPLKGILLKPENFDPNKKYPLMVYIYETLHQGLHSYRQPSPGTSVNPSFYVSNGYVMWMPDIEYDTGYPGKDALKCVLPGIDMLVREGFIDEDAIGIQGHSWGGYQIAYMITQTNIFAAVESGAPVSNMTSAYGGIRWGSGMVRQFQYERTQSRLGASLWEVPLRYIENSPIFWADKVKTPILMIHNDKDGAVPWYQGIEYIMALRRLNKEAYMFNYNGEDHGLRKRVNQEDWTIRMFEFFEHHLRGADAPDWMKNGIQAWNKEKK